MILKLNGYLKFAKIMKPGLVLENIMVSLRMQSSATENTTMCVCTDSHYVLISMPSPPQCSRRCPTTK
jgi:hypothetical protein